MYSIRAIPFVAAIAIIALLGITATSAAPAPPAARPVLGPAAPITSAAIPDNAPRLQHPSDGARLPLRAIDLKWLQPKGQTEARVQVMQGATVVVDEVVQQGRRPGRYEFAEGALQKGQTYTWRVEAGGEWSAYRTFGVREQP